MKLKEIDIGRTIDILDQFLETMNSNFHIISIKNDEPDLSYLRKFKIEIDEHIIIIKKDIFIEEYNINYLLINDDIEIIKKVNTNIEIFILNHLYWDLYKHYFKCFEIFLKLNRFQQRRIINDTYY